MGIRKLCGSESLSKLPSSDSPPMSNQLYLFDICFNKLNDHKSSEAKKEIRRQPGAGRQHQSVSRREYGCSHSVIAYFARREERSQIYLAVSCHILEDMVLSKMCQAC